MSIWAARFEYPDYLNIGGASTLFFVFIVLHTLLAGRRAAANPWGEGATTLEWRLPSPPPFHTYDDLPVIS